MEDNVMPWTLKRATESELLDLAHEVIHQNRKDLETAEIAWFLRSGKDKSWWGMTKKLGELEWMLSDGCEIAVQVNADLWGSRLLTSKGRRFLLDVLLARVSPKTGGKAHMEVEDGEPRPLYQVETQTITTLAAVIARHPEGHLELAEVAAIRKALTDPAQYLLDLQAAAAEDDEEDDDGADTTAPEPDQPIPYYRSAFVDLDGDGAKKVTLRFSSPNQGPGDLTGVHVHEPGTAKPGLPKMQAAGDLDFAEDAETVKLYRQHLEDELEEKARAAVKLSKTQAEDDADQEPAGPAPAKSSADEMAAFEGGEWKAPVAAISRKRKGA